MRYREFIKEIYLASIAKQRLFPTLKLFNEHYDENFGDFYWIDYLSGKELTSELTMDLVCTQVIVFGRSPEKIPELLRFYFSKNNIKPDKELMSLSGDAWLVLFQALDYGKKRAENKRRTSLP